MNFKANKPIYLQIVDFCFTKIITEEWLEGERIPSVRELGSLLQVNPNTAMRSYEYMQTENVIYMRRGMGYYVQQGAAKQIKQLQRKEFFIDVLPELFSAMDLLDIEIDEIIKKYNNRKNERL